MELSDRLLYAVCVLGKSVGIGAGMVLFSTHPEHSTALLLFALVCQQEGWRLTGDNR